MLEDLAIQYLDAVGGNQLIFYGLTIVGGVLAGATWRGTLALQRAPYFAWTNIILLTASFSQLIWLDYASAATGGYLWALVTLDLIVWFAIGFAICVIAVARSRDACGHGRMAALAFIPFANLWLILSPPKDQPNTNYIPTAPLFRGGLGVLTGFAVAAIAFGLRSWLPAEVEKRAAQWGQTVEGMAVNNRIMIRQQGLEAVIESLTAESEVPIQIDEFTTIVGTKAEGTTLRYIYKLNTDETALGEVFLSEAENYLCNYEPFIPVIRAGGKIVESYFNVNTRVIGEVSADAESCGLQ